MHYFNMDLCYTAGVCSVTLQTLPRQMVLRLYNKDPAQNASYSAPDVF